MKPIQRFIESIQIDKDTGCWLWRKSVAKGGYASFYAGKYYVGSRWAYEFFIRPIAKGYYVCHRCDNPRCVNPRHLFQGTATDNYLDGVQKKRVNAPRLTDEQVRTIRIKLKDGCAGAVLAREHGVKKHAIYDIKKRKTYRWVE